jgi:3-hydroxyisobutyrate dehydrogenase-like beta-hydroxyacid dehydrogenase
MSMQNTISPERTQRIARRLEDCGARFVDGGIIGPPATRRNQTWLYLAGDHAAGIAPCFSNGPLEVEVLAGGIGRASALKMCFAAYSKGFIALAMAVLAATERLNGAGGSQTPMDQKWSFPSRSGEA